DRHRRRPLRGRRGHAAVAVAADTRTDRTRPHPGPGHAVRERGRPAHPVRDVPGYRTVFRGRADHRHARLLWNRGAEQVRHPAGHRGMSQVLDIALLLLLATGSFFAFLGAFSLLKLRSFLRRLHGPTKASTLGVGCILIASIVFHIFYGTGLHPRELLIMVFLFLTAPVSAHMMSR